MVFSSQTGAFSPSQFTPSSTTPLTVKQIAAAQLTGPDEEGVPFVVDGVETDNIMVVGMVSGKAERATDVSFTIDDGTGRIDFIRWVNDAADSAETDAIQNGMYVSVIGTLKGLQDKKRATAFCVRPVTDCNEVPLHFTQCVQMLMENTKTMSQVTIRTNGSGTDLYTQVLNIFSEPASIESDHGVHIDEIAKRLRLPVSKIVDAINFHVDSGHIFSTIDDFHYKVNDAADSAETDAIQNGMYVSVIGTLKGLKDKKRATAFCVRPVTDYNEVPLMTSGTNGSVTDLYTQALNVFSEPASIESDHGVHIDEIAKRLRLPVSKIVDAINFHVDSGHIFSTIDDFHYKSAYID